MDGSIKNNFITTTNIHNNHKAPISFFTCKKKQISLPKYSISALLTQNNSNKGKKQDSNTNTIGEDSIKLSKIGM